MIQFYAPDILTNPVLPEIESQHCVKVLRHSAGDLIEVIDGAGHRMQCRILNAHQKHTLVEIVDSREIPRPWQGKITVAVAPTKHLDRMEWLVEKLVEIGIDRFVPLLCRHSERKELKTERLRKIAISAMKQSLKAEMPAIDEMTPLKAFVGSCNEGQRFVAYCDDAVERHVLARELVAGGDVTVMIGPEGDFSPEEIAYTLKQGFVPVTLGDCRLRTETAALCACQTIHVVNQLNI